MLFGVADKRTEGTPWRREGRGNRGGSSQCSYLSTVRRNDYSDPGMCVYIYARTHTHNRTYTYVCIVYI